MPLPHCQNYSRIVPQTSQGFCLRTLTARAVDGLWCREIVLCERRQDLEARFRGLFLRPPENGDFLLILMLFAIFGNMGRRKPNDGQFLQEASMLSCLRYPNPTISTNKGHSSNPFQPPVLGFVFPEPTDVG